MSPTGKIARLPFALREQVNVRLENNEPGSQILTWLNSHPKVREIMNSLFGGKPVNKQNLSAWRHSGFAEWQSRREFLGCVRDTLPDAAELEEAAPQMAEHAARVVSARYAIALTNWNGDPEQPAFARLKHISPLVRHIVALRRRPLPAAASSHSGESSPVKPGQAPKTAEPSPHQLPPPSLSFSDPQEPFVPQNTPPTLSGDSDGPAIPPLLRVA